MKKLINEIKEWNIHKEEDETSLLFTAPEQNNLPEKEIFAILLKKGRLSGLWSLKFGKLGNNSESEMYGWDENDPDRLIKTLFLKRVIEKEILPLVKNGKIKGVVFSPFGEDRMDSKRLALFKKIFDSINSKRDFDWKEEDGVYKILNHTSLTEVRRLLRKLIREEFTLANLNKKYEFSYDEINLINRDLGKLNHFLYSQTDNSPDLADKKMRLKRIIKIIDKKFS